MGKYSKYSVSQLEQELSKDNLHPSTKKAMIAELAIKASASSATKEASKPTPGPTPEQKHGYKW